MGTFGNIGSESRSDIVCLEGNGARPSHKGNGYSVGGAMYTLNSVEVHAVAYGVDLYNQSITGDKAKCITSKASDADHIPCVCYGLDTYNQNAEEELMPTIRTNGGGDCIPKVAYSIDPNSARYAGDVIKNTSTTVTANHPMGVVYAVENHPNDSRVKLAEDDIVQALTSRMGTGGGNVPLVMEKK